MPKASALLRKLEMPFSRGKVKKRDVLILSYLLSVLVFCIVYLTGGTSKVYANLMYIPIAIAASTNGIKKAVIHAIFSAFLVGPIMPMEVEGHVLQDSLSWILRMAIYIIIASVIGFFSYYYKREFEINRKKSTELSEAHYSMIYSLVKLAESRDDNTGEHIERVALFSKLLAEKLRDNPKYKGYISDDYIENIYRASPLHDIGKVGIPDSILLKPGKLNEHEYEIMKEHTTIGAKTLLEVKKRFPENRLLELGISITNYHHEKWDGSGYPEGLKGADIPLAARIMAVADVYDALRSKRIYKEAYEHEKAVEIIKKGRGSHFDPEIVDVFLENQAEFDYLYKSASISA